MVNWTFPGHQSNKEIHFRDCRFSEKMKQKKIVLKNTRVSRKFQKNIMAGGMSTTTDNTMLLWDNSVFLGDDRQGKCLTVDL